MKDTTYMSGVRHLHSAGRVKALLAEQGEKLQALAERLAEKEMLGPR